jgi:phage host-nuclease inhibitor protein Gam
MMEHDADQPDHGPFAGISAHLAEHLRQEMWDEIRDLGEIQQAVYQMEGKANRRVRKVKAHIMSCGTCLSDQIKTGMLVTLSDYWHMREDTGGGRYPKLHYQVN